MKVPMMKIIKLAEKPSSKQIGQNKVAIIGIVPKEVPMMSPIKSIAKIAKNLFPSTKGITEFTSSSTAPLCFKTSP